MEDSESEVAQISGVSGDTVSEIESLSDQSENDLKRIEADIDKRVVHDSTTGEMTIILPSDVPNRLPIVTDETRYETTVVKEDLSEVFKMCEPVSSESELSDEEQSTKQQLESINSESDWETNDNKYPSFLNVQQTVTEPRTSALSDPRNSICPIRGCQFVSRKIKHHVQHMHLPRIMWDNPQPPIKDEKIDEANVIRREALVYLTQCILGKSIGISIDTKKITNC